MATTTTTMTIHAPIPRAANAIILSNLAKLSASARAPQPPKRVVAPSTIPRPNPHVRRLPNDNGPTAILRRVEFSKYTVAFPPSESPRPRSNPTTARAPVGPLTPILALHNAERRVTFIPSRDRAFRSRPMPAARGKCLVEKIPTLREGEEFKYAAPLPVSVGLLHPMVRTKASRPRPRPRRPVTDENTVMFPTTPESSEAPLVDELPKRRRALSNSTPRRPFTPLAFD